MTLEHGLARIVSELWLEELGRLTDHVIHDVRNGMHAAGINIEVIRSRSEKEGGKGSPSDFHSFASNAGRQVDEVARRVLSLLALGRNPDKPAEVCKTLEHLSSVLRTGTRDPLRVNAASGEAPIGLNMSAIRLLLTHAVLGPVKAGAAVDADVTRSGVVSVRLRFDRAGDYPFDSNVTAVTEALHVRIESSNGERSLTFPTPVYSDSLLV